MERDKLDLYMEKSIDKWQFAADLPVLGWKIIVMDIDITKSIRASIWC